MIAEAGEFSKIFQTIIVYYIHILEIVLSQLLLAGYWKYN